MSGIFVVPDRPIIGIKTSLTTLKKYEAHSIAKNCPMR